MDRIYYEPIYPDIPIIKKISAEYSINTPQEIKHPSVLILDFEKEVLKDKLFASIRLVIQKNKYLCSFAQKSSAKIIDILTGEYIGFYSNFRL